jgi:hypothetical protein
MNTPFVPLPTPEVELAGMQPWNSNSWKDLTKVLDYNQNAQSGGPSWAS